MNDRHIHETGGLIRDWHLKLITPPCIPGAETWSARACLANDITGVLPFLNGSLENADYYREAEVLVWRRGKKKCAFRPREISAAPVESREEAVRLIDELVRLVNDTWEKRTAIEASYERKEPPGLMEIYALLPRTNCGECGYPTCMAFAVQVKEGREDPSKCPRLSDTGSEQLHRLLN